MEYDVIRKNGRLYDKRYHTDEWDDKVECDVVREF